MKTRCSADRLRSLFAAWLGLWLAPALAAVEPPKVLVTTFDPFGGSPLNNTQAIGKELLKLASVEDPALRIVICNLPVIYDEAAKVALECESREKPDLVVSLGEAGCSLQLETAATNLDDASLPDNAGDVFQDRPIDPEGPYRVGFGFPVQALYCGLGEDSADAVVSHSPGSFVCNNTSYHLSRELGSRGVPFTFIHVPNSSCPKPVMNPARNASRIFTAVTRAWDWMLELPLQDTATPWPWPGNGKTLPTAGEGVQALLAELQKSSAPACEIEFTKRLFSSY